jgi:SOS response regulatory protein OraA/RecX
MNKLTDAEIVEKVTKNLKRSKCLEPFEARDIIEQKNVKIAKLTKEINFQKAEIERLEIALSNEEANQKVMYKLYKQAKTEAIKEYKEKVKQYLIDKGLFIVTVKNALDEAEKRMEYKNDEDRNSN